MLQFNRQVTTEMPFWHPQEPGWFTSLWWSNMVCDIINDQFEVIQ